jgi:D-alanine-D-alanine ligase
MARRLKKLRIVTLMHEDLVPPDDVSKVSQKEFESYKSEYDVVSTLRGLGHEVRKLGLYDELHPLRTVIKEWKPHVVFNLLEEFRGLPIYDHNVVSYLELLHVSYTGNNPRGMVLARDKALTKKILRFHRIRTPRFAVFPLGRRARLPASLSYPLIVKSQLEEASLGIAQRSVVESDAALAERVAFVHEHVGTAAICEQYIDGREINVGVLGNRRLETLPAWELRFSKLPEDSWRIATQKAKWDLEYQERHGIDLGRAEDLAPATLEEMATMSKRAYRSLELSGYGRMDFRVSTRGTPYLIEANPNCDISRDEELASAANAAGYSYGQLLQRIVNLGLRRSSPIRRKPTA